MSRFRIAARRGLLTRGKTFTSDAFVPAISTSGSVTFSNGNRTIASSASNCGGRGGHGRNTGKLYFEMTLAGGGASDCLYGCVDGTATFAANQYVGSNNGFGYDRTGSYFAVTGAGTTPTYTTGDIMGLAFDIPNNKLYWSKNGTYFGTQNPAAGTGGSTPSLGSVSNLWYPAASCSTSNNFTMGTTKQTCSFNPPSGFSYWN